MQSILMVVFGISAGFLTASGVFTALSTVGLIPRFAGKTHTGKHVFLYEEMVVSGAIAGTFLSVFFHKFKGFFDILRLGIENDFIKSLLVKGIEMIFGFFSGIYVGCVALAIAEMLDSIPIFSRRIGFRHGLGIAVVFMALGKVAGSFLYYYYKMF